MKTEKKDFLSVDEFAEELSLHPNTIRKMIRNGRLSTFRTGAGKKSSYRISRSEINRLAVVDLEVLINEKVEKILKEKEKP